MGSPSALAGNRLMELNLGQSSQITEQADSVPFLVPLKENIIFFL